MTGASEKIMKIDGPPALRTWTGTGDFSANARFGEIINHIVTLVKEDNTKIKIPLDRLSTADQRWIEERCAGR